MRNFAFAQVAIPTGIAVICVYYKIFRHMCNPEELEDTQKMQLEHDHNFMVFF